MPLERVGEPILDVTDGHLLYLLSAGSPRRFYVRPERGSFHSGLLGPSRLSSKLATRAPVSRFPTPVQRLVSETIPSVSEPPGNPADFRLALSSSFALKKIGEIFERPACRKNRPVGGSPLQPQDSSITSCCPTCRRDARPCCPGSARSRGRRSTGRAGFRRP